MGLDSIQKLILRTILRQANVLRKNKRTLWLQTTPLISEFQSSTYSSAQEDLQSFINIFPLNIQQFLLDNIPSRVINGNDLRRATVGAFRANPLQQSAPNQSSDALKCMKIINDQVRLMDSTSITNSKNDVRVVATAVYDSRPDELKLMSFENAPHSFYYRIAIQNNGEHPIKLVGRHWVFTSDKMVIDVPKWASGVLGLKPIIYPGKIFQYMSMTHLQRTEGTMEGAFLIEDTGSGEVFEVKVGQCTLTKDVHTDT